MPTKYDTMTDEEFDRILADIVYENARNLLSVPGVYEVVSEHFNNEVRERWKREIEDEREIEEQFLLVFSDVEGL